MSQEATIQELIELAIAAEQSAHDLYDRLSSMFAHNPEISGFWRRYAAEETGHANWLRSLKGRLSAEQLAEQADPSALAEATRSMEHSVDTLLKDVENLEDAHQLASELEGSETNAVFTFLIEHFSADEKTRTFLRTQLGSHIGRLSVDLPVGFQGVGNRRALKAIRPENLDS